MQPIRLSLIAGVIVLTITAALFAFVWTGPSPAATVDGLSWQAVSAQVTTGRNIGLTVRLVDANSRPVTTPITVTATRLDMGPEGMATMQAPLRPVVSSAPGVFVFDADLVMAGRWALTIAGTIPGNPRPVSGTVIFTAAETRSEASPEPAGERRILYYRNPMGLADVSPIPKKDAMGMSYIPVYVDEASGPAGTVTISPEKIQRSGVRTQTVERRLLSQTVRAVGTVMHDESRLATTTVKFEGFVEELFVSATGAEVRAGQPLLRVWIESKDILDRQIDYVLALRGTGRIEQAEQNLRIFGLPDQVIEDLKKTRSPIRSIVLTAPQYGIVLEKPAVVGMRFAAGDVLFKTVDHSTVWVVAQVAERDLGALRVGQTARVSLTAYPNATFEGRIALIYPELDMTTRTALVRIVVPNKDHRLMIGQYADVTIDARRSDARLLAVPDSAVIDNGSRQVVFVAKDRGVFEPHDVTLGNRGEGYVEIRKGLTEGERIVTTGNFLIDAESNLKSALAAFTAPGVEP